MYLAAVHRRPRRLGSITDSIAADYNYVATPIKTAFLDLFSSAVPILPTSTLSNPFDSLFAPGSNAGDVVANAATGNLTSSQLQTLRQQETDSLIQAGASPAAAASQAQSDVAATTATSGSLSGANWLTIALFAIAGIVLIKAVTR